MISYFKFYQLFGAVQLEVLFYELHYPPNLSVWIHGPFFLLHYRCISCGFQEYVDWKQKSTLIYQQCQLLTVSNDSMTVSKESERMWKEVVVAYFVVLSWFLPQGIDFGVLAETRTGHLPNISQAAWVILLGDNGQYSQGKWKLN